MTLLDTLCKPPATPATDTRVHVDTGNMYLGNASKPAILRADLAAEAERLRAVHDRVVSGMRPGLEGEFACLTLHEQMQPWLRQIEETAEALRDFEDVIVIGIGGSSLGAKAVYHALQIAPADHGGPALHFLENVDPYLLHHLLSHLQPETTAVIAISKSGGTIETVTQYLIVREWLRHALGDNGARERQWVVTDPVQGWLRDLARRENLPSLAVPPRVGGRYSVLTPVGLLPLAVIGVDIRALLHGAAGMAARCAAETIEENVALEMAALYYLQDVRRAVRTSIMMPYVSPLKLYVDWYCQLWAESLGKKVETSVGTVPAGTLPVRAMGAVDQHSQLQMYLESRYDKMFTFLALTHWPHDCTIPLPEPDRKFFPYLHNQGMSAVIDAEFRATRDVITDTGHPNLTLELPTLNADVLGQLIDLYQRVTVYAGLLYGVNPLDQPAVEKGKQLAVQHLRATHP
jgi:glucose-6-phosphate isomerase